MRRVHRLMGKSMGHAPKDERWTRLQVDVPPEVAETLMRLHRADMGANASSATRQGLLRSALLEWWQAREPEADAPIEAYATEIVDLREIEAGPA